MARVWGYRLSFIYSVINPDFAIAKSARRAATPQFVASSGVNPAAGGLRQNLHNIFLYCVSRRYFISNANFGIKEHNGNVKVKSEENQGVVFRIYPPVILERHPIMRSDEDV